MPPTPHDFDLDPAKDPQHDRDDEAERAPGLDDDDEVIELEQRVSRSAEASDEAEEAELAEEDILEMADLEDELAARKGEGSDA
jgi:hypothetical protein